MEHMFYFATGEWISSDFRAIILRILNSFGAAFTSFYRLVGPFRSENSAQVIKGEIYETITRSIYLTSSRSLTDLEYLDED